MTGLTLGINSRNVVVAVIAVGCRCISVIGKRISRRVVTEFAVVIADDVSSVTEVTSIRTPAVTGNIK
jgi:hypothetical protein